MLYVVIYAISRCIFLAIIYLDNVTGKTAHLGIVRICLKQVLPFNKLTDYQLKAQVLGKVLTSPKLLSTNDYLLFPEEECENKAKIELMTADNFYH